MFVPGPLVHFSVMEYYLDLGFDFVLFCCVVYLQQLDSDQTGPQDVEIVQMLLFQLILP